MGGDALTNFSYHKANTKLAFKKKLDSRILKALSAVLLCTLGLALITTCVVTAVATYGATTPLSIKGMALGGTLLASGLTIGAGLFAGTVAMGGSFKLFDKKDYSGKLANAMEGVTVEAKNVRNKL